MSKTLIRTFFGEDADFFIGKFVKISNIEELNIDGRSVVKVTFETEN